MNTSDNRVGVKPFPKKETEIVVCTQPKRVKIFKILVSSVCTVFIEK